MRSSGIESYPDTHHDIYSKTLFGFWLYILTDFMLFATLFATYIVLSGGTFGGRGELFNLPLSFLQTLVFLTTSLTSGLGSAFAHRKNSRLALLFFSLTFVLGIAFLSLQFKEFSDLLSSGNSWAKNAFLSAFFSLVGMHTLHVIFAMLWILVLLIPVFCEGITSTSLRRLVCLKMFWQFLNIVWVFIFTLVYLMGAKTL